MHVKRPMLKLSNILLPLDFSEPGKAATPYAAALAHHFHATLTVLHVNEVYSRALVAPEEFHGPIDTGWITALELERLREMESYQDADFRGLEVRRVVVSGDPAQRIAEQARKEKTGLIVMPTHGYGPFRRFLLGSVTAKVLHDVDCPVWTGAHMQEPSRHGWKAVTNVLCAIDSGPASEHVLTWARDFADEFGALITVVHAISAPGPEDGRTTRTVHAREEIECLMKKLGIPGVIDIEGGEPGKAVTAAAAQANADVLVIGRSPRSNGLGRLYANAYAIIRESTCPVVSV